MKTETKIVMAVFSMIGWLIVISMFYFVYVTAWKENRIGTYTFGDTGYELTISQIGDPDWPFGDTHCRFDFTRRGETVSRQRIDVANDGVPVFPGNFRVHWFGDFVRVVVRAEEQPMTLYDLYCDGTTEKTISWPAGRTEKRVDAREKAAKILDLDLPPDSCDRIDKDTYSIYRPGGAAMIFVDFHGSNTVQEQIEEKGTWRSLPMPKEFRSLTEEIGVNWAGDTDEELGEGYWFFLDRHEDAADHYDFYAALDREEMHCIAAIYLERYQSLMLLQYDSENE